MPSGTGTLDQGGAGRLRLFDDEGNDWARLRMTVAREPDLRLLALVLASVPGLGCSADGDHAGDYETRVAFLAFKPDDPIGKSDCARPAGIALADSSLVVGNQDGRDYIRFQSCQIAGRIKEDRFTAENAPCSSFGDAGEPKYPHRIYDYVEVDFDAGTIRLTSSDLGPESIGQCNQLDGYIRRPGEGWRPDGASLWIAEAPWDIVWEQFQGAGEISTYLQRRPDGSQHVLGLSCTFNIASGGAPSSEGVTCEAPFHGEHQVPTFVPGEFKTSESGISLRGEFQGTDRTYEFAFETTSVELAP